MNLSDAIERGVLGLMSRGPDFDQNDPYRAAFRGVHGRDPSEVELGDFYHAEPWGFPSDTEYALRVICLHKPTWHECIQVLRANGL